MDNADDLFEFLRKGRWFGSLPEPLQLQIVERASPRRFAKGEAIIRHGAPTRGMHVVLVGRVRCHWPLGNGSETLVHVGEAGLWFGEFALVRPGPCLGTFVADTPVRTLCLTPDAFARIVDDEPRYYRNFAKLSLDRYAIALRYYAESNALSKEEWLRVRLQDLAAMQRASLGTRGPVEIGVSQAELATLVGVSRQTLSTLLGRLAARGLIKVGFRSIRVLDVSAAPEPLAR